MKICLGCAIEKKFEQIATAHTLGPEAKSRLKSTQNLSIVREKVCRIFINLVLIEIL